MRKPIVVARGMSKSFPGVKALDQVHLELWPRPRDAEKLGFSMVYQEISLIPHSLVHRRNTI